MKIKPSAIIELFLFSFMFVFGFGYIIRRFPVLQNTALYALILAGIFAILFKYIDKKTYREIGFRKFTLTELKYAFYTLLALFPVALLGRLLDPSYDIWYAQGSNLLTLSTVISINIAMPLFVLKEELVARSLLQSRLKEYGWLAALILSVNFAFSHFFLGSYHAITLVMSVLVGYFLISIFYEKTKNVFLTFLTHLIYNCILIYQIFLHATNQVIPEIIFWAVYGILFLLTAKNMYSYFRESIKPIRLSAGDYIFITAFCLFPLIIILMT